MSVSSQNGFKAIARNVLRDFNDDELMTRAAALAFYSALSLAPILVLLLWVLASLRPEWQSQLIQTLTDLVGEQAGSGLRIVINHAGAEPELGNMAGLIGLGVTLVGASMVFAQLQRAINHIWGVRARPGRAWLAWLRSRAHAVGLLLSVALLLIISFSSSALIAVFISDSTWVWRAFEIITTLVLFTLVFAAIYKVLPDAIITWRGALSGALITSVLFTLGKLGIGLYLERSGVGGAYGPASGVIVLLVWIYYSALILLFGAELTEVLADISGTPIQPRAYAMRDQTESNRSLMAAASSAPPSASHDETGTNAEGRAD